jgi:hypothetical protein
MLLCSQIKTTENTRLEKRNKVHTQKADLPPWTTTITTRTTYNLGNENDKLWIKNYDQIFKIFILAQGKQFSRKEFTKYCWNRKDINITAKWNSLILEDNWEKHSLQPQENSIKYGKLHYILNTYVNICKLDIFENYKTTLIELKLHDSIDSIEQ